MRRRHFIGLAGATTLDFVGPAYAQTKPNLPLIGVLISEREDVRGDVCQTSGAATRQSVFA
jgi:hypothetical protein